MARAAGQGRTRRSGASTAAGSAAARPTAAGGRQLHPVRARPAPARRAAPPCAGHQSGACNGVRLYLTTPRRVASQAGCSGGLTTYPQPNGVGMASATVCNAYNGPDTYDLSTSAASDTVLITQAVYGYQVRGGRGGRRPCRLRGAQPAVRPGRAAAGRSTAARRGRAARRFDAALGRAAHAWARSHRCPAPAPRAAIQRLSREPDHRVRGGRLLCAHHLVREPERRLLRLRPQPARAAAQRRQLHAHAAGDLHQRRQSGKSLAC